MTIERTTNYSLCKRCKSKRRTDCCSSMGGAYSSSDFGNQLTVTAVKNLLKEGKGSISSYMYLPETLDTVLFYLYLRAPEIGKGPIDLLSISQPCAFWTPEIGCSIRNVTKRPFGCAAMEPSSDGNCIRHYSDNLLLEDWGSHQDVLKEVVWDYTHKTTLQLLQKEAKKLYPMVKQELTRYMSIKYAPPSLKTVYLYLVALGYTF